MSSWIMHWYLNLYWTSQKENRCYRGHRWFSTRFADKDFISDLHSNLSLQFWFHLTIVLQLIAMLEQVNTISLQIRSLLIILVFGSFCKPINGGCYMTNLITTQPLKTQFDNILLLCILYSIYIWQVLSVWNLWYYLHTIIHFISRLVIIR